MRHWRRWATGALVFLLVGAAMMRRDELGAAADEIGSLSPGWLAVVAVFTATSFVVNGAFTRAVTPGISVAQGVMVQQATTAANSTIIGGGPVSTGLRVAMLRSWSVNDHHIGLSIVASNLVASYTVWLVALATAVVGTTGAAGDVVGQGMFVALIGVAVLVLTASTALWWMLLRHPRWAAWLARRAQRVWDAVRRRAPRLPHADIEAITEEGRRNAGRLARTCGGRIVALTLLDQVFAVARPVIVVRALGIDAGMVTTVEILVAYGLVRLASALTPIPGGLGVADIGMATLLIRFGGPESTVVAAVLAYRALTFLLPMVTGGFCFLAWRMLSPRDGRPAMPSPRTRLPAPQR